MPSNEKPNTCPKCGAVAELADEGVCPSCMLEEGLETHAPTIKVVPADTQGEALAPLAMGARIGRYKILESIGEGGCGVVYMAEQEEPVRRRVALKVIKLGMDTKQVVGRFEAERQALALMDHPGIAKVFDGGATPDGRPYFVMELVRGVRITDYCDQNQLSTAERLALFVQVCRAVQHAHQKGIIHRDIKPSNILVTLLEGKPTPKVIDFGIAKATDQSLTDKTLFTAFQQFIGTPAYMSPEQADFTTLDIDTRSDIYSLGVLLYELLTGKTPFDTKELLEAGLEGIRHALREKEPPRPSTRLNTLTKDELTTTAKRRRTDAPQLVHLLAGDLDWIVMKAMEKDRTRRYETANGLATDIQRHLNDEPVLARPPSQLYRFKKLVRRNRLAVTAAGLVFLALFAGVAGTTWGLLKAVRQKREAERQTKIAHQSMDFLTGMFKTIDPAVARQREITVREVLDKAAHNISGAFPGEPLTEIPIRDTFAEIYHNLGRDNEALSQVQTNIDLSRIAYEGKDHPELAARLENCAGGLLALGRMEAALASANAAYEMWQRLGTKDEAQLAHSLDYVAYAQLNMGNASGALPKFEQALAIRQKLYKTDHAEITQGLNNVATCLDHLGRSAEALPRHKAASEMLQRLYKGDHPFVAKNLSNLGSCYRDLDRLEDALKTYEEALAMRQRLYKEDHPETAISLNSVALCLQSLGRSSNALPKAQASYEMFQRLYKGDHQDVAWSLNSVGNCLIGMSRPDEALTSYRQTLEMRQRLYKGNSREVAETLNSVALCLDAMGNHAESLSNRLAAAEMFEKLTIEQPSNRTFKLDLANSYKLTGDLLVRTHEPARAAEFYRKGIGIAETVLAADSSNPQAGKLRQNLRLRIGLDLADVTIIEVIAASQGAKLGIQKDDLVTSIGGAQVKGSDHLAALQKVFRHAKTELEISRNGNPLKFVLEPGPLGLKIEDRNIRAARP